MQGCRAVRALAGAGIEAFAELCRAVLAICGAGFGRPCLEGSGWETVLKVRDSVGPDSCRLRVLGSLQD